MFHFVKEVDPKNPIDPEDTLPPGWDLVNTPKRVKALPGHGDDIYLACLAWQKREIARLRRAEAEAVAVSVSGYGMWAEAA